VQAIVIAQQAIQQPSIGDHPITLGVLPSALRGIRASMHVDAGPP
jgi:hypothetical protein